MARSSRITAKHETVPDRNDLPGMWATDHVISRIKGAAPAPVAGVGPFALDVTLTRVETYLIRAQQEPPAGPEAGPTAGPEAGSTAGPEAGLKGESA